MKITKTNYGLLVTIPETDNNSEFIFELRQVRTINNDDPNEQPLINRLERKEKALTQQFFKLVEEMEALFALLITREDWQAWEEKHGDFNRLFHDKLDELAERINGVSFAYAEKSAHGYCL